MRKIIFALFLVMPLLRLQSETPGDAIKSALNNSAALDSARTGIQAAELDLKSAKRDYLPVICAGASYLYNSAESEITLPSGTINMIQNHTVDFSGTVQWPVFTGFARKTAVEMRNIAVEVSRNKLVSRQIQTALETLVYYRQVQSAGLQIDSLQSGRDRLALQLKQLEELNRQGMATESDILSLRLSLLEYDQQIISARSDLGKARAGLLEKTGKEPEVDEAPGDISDLPLPVFQPENIPALAAYRLQEEQAAAQGKLERASLYPKVVLNSTVHYGLPGANPVANDWMFYFTAGAAVSWSTDWGASGARGRAAEKRSESAYLAGADVLAETKLKFDRDLQDLKTMYSQLEVLREASELTGEKSSIIENQYKQGMATVTDFTDAALARTLAELRYRTQTLLVLLKLNQLEASGGTPIENWSVNR